MPSIHYLRACQIANHGNKPGSEFHTMTNLMKFYKTELIFFDFPFAANEGKIDNTSVRMILWSILVTMCKSSLAYLRPYDMALDDQKLATLIRSLYNFSMKLDADTFFVAKRHFSAFVDENWLRRPLMLKFNYFYATQMTTFMGIEVLRFFQIHMTYLVDIEFKDVVSGNWTTPQFIYSKVLFKLPSDVEQYPDPHDGMAVYPTEKLLSDVWVFNHPWRNLDTMCESYLRNYVIYVRSNCNKKLVLEIANTIQRQHYPSVVDRTLNFTRLVLINLADVQAPHHKFVRKNAYTFMFERFYDQYIQKIFEAEVAAVIPAEQDDCIRSTVRRNWLTHPPTIIDHMTKIHVRLWGNFYTNAFLGL